MQPLETLLEIVDFIAESDSQVSVHTEVIAGHDEDALLLTEPRHELCRIDRMAVADVHDRAGVGRRVAEEVAVGVEPSGDDREVAIENGTGAFEDAHSL